jgi:serine/threonine protein kinase
MMTSTIERPGWESLVQKENLSLTQPGSDGVPTNVLGTLKQRLPWCNLIAMLQKKGLTGFRTDFVGYGDLVGIGTNFMVTRHTISLNTERKAYQDQNKEWLSKGSVVALKRLIPRVNDLTGEVDFRNSKQFNAVALEVRALSMSRLREHDNIVNMIGVVWERRGGAAAVWPTIVLEYCEHNLSEYQRSSEEPLTINKKMHVGRAIGAGISAIHSLFIVHGDIKSENILIKISDYGEAIPKLADFGCSLLDLEEENGGEVPERVWVGGTNPWRAPEVKQQSFMPLLDQLISCTVFR